MGKNKNNKNHQDPFAEREALNYADPIPSREMIMQVLSNVGEPLTRQQVGVVLGLHESTELEALKRRLRAMERDGQLIRNRRGGYCLPEKMDLIKGRVIAHPDGFGFLVPEEDTGGDLFLSARQMRQVFHGDVVIACVSGIDKRGRREGTLVEVLERHTQQIVGRFVCDHGIRLVVPDNKRIIHDILISEEHQGSAKDGQIVVVELIEQPKPNRPPTGSIVEVLGEHMAPGMEIDVALRAHQLSFQWPKAVTKELDKFDDRISDSSLKGREDLRHVPLVTIDGADAKDFDDAVFCQPQGKQWRLLVAIADVAHYVRSGTALDQEAIERGTSVYFPGRVIPMLPEVLSNGLCSINPKQDRLSLVCEMMISNAGLVTSKRFFNAVINSHGRLTYDEVAAMLKADKEIQGRYKSLVTHIENLFNLYLVLQKQRKKRGTIEFETTETVIEFGEHKKIERIVPLVRNDAHRMIEEFMIAANASAAQFLLEAEIPALYRIHDLPSGIKVTDLRSFLSQLGLQLDGGERPEAKNFSKLLESIRDRPDRQLIQTVVLRSMNQAVYSPNNVGHFGLALAEYLHFTSPIRRYPDLLVHRAIKHVLMKIPVSRYIYSESQMLSFAENCSIKERRADDATRDVVDWLKCEYMLDKVGDIFDGIITSVLNFGLFVELKDIHIEGLVHVTSLKNDYYHFDPIKHRLLGEQSKKSYRLADVVKVRVVRVDLEEKKIDFEVVLEEGQRKSFGKKHAGKGTQKKLAKKSKKSPQQKKKTLKKKKAIKQKDKKKSKGAPGKSSRNSLGNSSNKKASKRSTHKVAKKKT
jgi:ribonuclease R